MACSLRIADFLLRTNWLFSQAINEMKQRQNRMLVKHAGTGVPHHDPDLLPHNGPVTMHRALGARRFILLERTFVEALPVIIEKLSALKAKLVLLSMLAMTIDAYHSLNSIVLPCHSRMVVRHDKYPLMLVVSHQVSVPPPGRRRSPGGPRPLPRGGGRPISESSGLRSWPRNGRSPSPLFLEVEAPVGQTV